MRTLIAIALCAILCGCPAQTQFFTTGYATKKDGTKVPVPVLTASIGQDLNGDVHYADATHCLSVTMDPKWAGKFLTIQTFDAKGNLVKTEQKPVIAGMSSSKVIKSWIGPDGAKGIVHESTMGAIETAAVPVGGGVISKGLSLFP